VEVVLAAAERGDRTAYVTNNASRRPADVAAHLAEMGFPATADDVVTSSQAAAALLAEQLEPGSPVLIVGTDALAAEVSAVGLGTTREADGAVAVVQGHSPDTGWRILAEATVALRAGAVWVACNLDPTLPTERGPLPGNGSMVSVLRIASGREPQVAGKPGPRPDYIAADMGGLTATPDDLAPGRRPGWDVTVGADGLLTLAGAGDQVDALRALCGAHWAVGGGPAMVTSDGAEAERAVKNLALGAEGVGSATVGGEGSLPGAHR
jgi:hypothetical protein